MYLDPSVMISAVVQLVVERKLGPVRRFLRFQLVSLLSLESRHLSGTLLGDDI